MSRAPAPQSLAGPDPGFEPILSTETEHRNTEVPKKTGTLRKSCLPHFKGSFSSMRNQQKDLFQLPCETSVAKQPLRRKSESGSDRAGCGWLRDGPPRRMNCWRRVVPWTSGTVSHLPENPSKATPTLPPTLTKPTLPGLFLSFQTPAMCHVCTGTRPLTCISPQPQRVGTVIISIL